MCPDDGGGVRPGRGPMVEWLDRRMRELYPYRPHRLRDSAIEMAAVA